MHDTTRRLCPHPLSLAVLAAIGVTAGPGLAATAQQILKAAGVRGGLIVHVGCGEGKLTADLRASKSYLVHGLDTDRAAIDRAREHIRSRGLSGPVSVDLWDGKRLPYVDNLVNLLVVSEHEDSVSRDDIMRVLVPGGVALAPRSSSLAPLRKSWPADIDEWTHYLHDPTNNAVAHDTVVGPPKHYQWHGSPRWSRHHESMGSTSALVSAKGRLFYIFDEGSKASILLPAKWFLTARDAFNGTILWKRRIGEWHTHLWPLKSGPADLPRRLVAVDDRVYVTLAIDAPVSALDAATGETVRTYEATKGTQEIVVSDDTLLLSIDEGREATAGSVQAIRKQQRTMNRDGAKRTVMAVQAESGEVLWRVDTQVVPLTLAANAGRVFFYDGDRVVCLNGKSGKRHWASQSLPRSKTFPSYYAPTLVVYNDVVIFAGGENMLHLHGAQDTMQALSVETGKLLWTAEHPPSGYQSPEDILVADGLVWTGATTQSEDSGEFTGRDPLTGEVRRRYVPKALPTTGYGHHRCYRAKATDRFVLTSTGGINFLDVRSTKRVSYGWIRGVCLYGIMPCNGLIYAPPHDCACSMDSKLYAFSAVAARRSEEREARSEGARLERGPAFDAIGNRQSPIGNPNDWPMHRHDAMRSGRTASRVPTDLKQIWQTGLGGRLSCPVVADNKVYVASVDAHTIHALDLASGKVAWSYTAGGRVDSPPTIWRGLVLFGAANGYVHCLRASDGCLAWRFRAAPEDRRITGFEQVESVWPVSGSVLVLDGPTPGSGVVYCAAGRTPYLDGGVRLLRLDARTGRKLSETVIDGSRRRNAAAPDILSSDGKHVYLKSLRFTLDGVAKGAPTRDVKQQVGESVHLFSPTSLLDDAWWHRSYWVYGRAFQTTATGYYNAGLMAPAGRILVFDDLTAYGFGRKAKYYRWTTPLEHVLFAADTQRSTFELPAPRRGRKSSIQVGASESFGPGRRPTTIEAWVKADAGNGVVMARGGKAEGWALLIWSGKPKLVVRTGKQLTTVAANRNVVRKWVHLAGVLTERKALLYVDGEPASTADLSRMPSLGKNAALDIGLDSGNAVGNYRGAYGFRGAMDEVRVYRGVVSPDEIRQHAAEPTQTASAAASVALRYSFDRDKAKGQTTDSSGNNRHGTSADLRLVEGKAGKGARFVGTRPSILKLPFAVSHHWAHEIPMLVRAMVLADRTLFIAGPPDLVDEEAAARSLNDPATQTALREQGEALEGRKGALLWAVSTSGGQKMAELKLDAPPVFDGMIAAHGRLLFSTTDGRLVCLGAD